MFFNPSHPVRRDTPAVSLGDFAPSRGRFFESEPPLPELIGNSFHGRSDSSALKRFRYWANYPSSETTLPPDCHDRPACAC